MDILAADQAPQQKPRGFIIELFADLRADQAVVLRGGLHLGRLEDFFHHRQILRPAFVPCAARLANGGFGRIGLLQRGGPGFSLRGSGQLEQKQLQLGGIELLVAGAEQAPHQPVDLLLHQAQMLLEVGDALITLGDLGQKLLAAQGSTLVIKSTSHAKLNTHAPVVFSSRSYHGRNLAPRKSTPSVNRANASGRNRSFFLPSVSRGHEKVPASKRLLKSHSPVPSK